MNYTPTEVFKEIVKKNTNYDKIDASVKMPKKIINKTNQNLVRMADAAAEKYGIDKKIFRSLINHESGWRIGVTSPAGAIGLGQLMPGTARGLGVTNPKDPSQNLEGSAKYLSSQLKRFGSYPLALAAYNAGPGAVKKYGGIPPYRETQNYVRKILGSKSNNMPMISNNVVALSQKMNTPTTTYLKQPLLDFSFTQPTEGNIMANNQPAQGMNLYNSGWFNNPNAVYSPQLMQQQSYQPNNLNAVNSMQNQNPNAFRNKILLSLLGMGLGAGLGAISGQGVKGALAGAAGGSMLPFIINQMKKNKPLQNTVMNNQPNMNNQYANNLANLASTLNVFKPLEVNNGR